MHFGLIVRSVIRTGIAFADAVLGGRFAHSSCTALGLGLHFTLLTEQFSKLDAFIGMVEKMECGVRSPSFKRLKVEKPRLRIFHRARGARRKHGV